MTEKNFKRCDSNINYGVQENAEINVNPTMLYKILGAVTLDKQKQLRAYSYRDIRISKNTDNSCNHSNKYSAPWINHKISRCSNSNSTC